MQDELSTFTVGVTRTTVTRLCEAEHLEGIKLVRSQIGGDLTTCDQQPVTSL